MNILKTLVITSILTLGLTLIGQAHASGSNCAVGMYGQSVGPCTKIVVDKKVQKPGTKDFVDSLSALDSKYHVGDTVTFQIVVQNTGKDITNLEVVDTLPQNVQFVSGPGKYDKSSNKLSFNISSLESGKSQTFYITTKVVDSIAFGNNGYVCVNNYVHAKDKNGATSDDAAQFCVERVLKVYPPKPVKQAPPTGPEAVAIPALYGMAGAGMYLRKRFNA
jgi:uncharacterized repeat protein (TIGR01451 family)